MSYMSTRDNTNHKDKNMTTQSTVKLTRTQRTCLAALKRALNNGESTDAYALWRSTAAMRRLRFETASFALARLEDKGLARVVVGSHELNYRLV